MKKLINLLFAIIMILVLATPVMTITANAAADSQYTWNYDSATKTLSISGCPPEDDNYPWKEYIGKIKALHLNLPDVYKAFMFEDICRSLPNLEEIKVNKDTMTFFTVDGVLYDHIQMLYYPPAKKDKIYTVPKFVEYFDSSFDLPDCITEIKVEKGNRHFKAKDGVLYNYDMTEIVYYPKGKKDMVFTVPKGMTEETFMSFSWNLPSCLTTIKVENGSKYLKAKDGILYNYAMTEMLYYPWSKTTATYTVPKEITAKTFKSFSRSLPSCLTTIKVENGNKYLKAKDGVLYDYAMTEMLYYPWSKTAMTYTVPKTVKKLSADFSDHISEFKVENGNKEFRAKDGVLYNYAITELIAYPQEKAADTYTVPKTVKKMPVGSRYYISAFKVANGNKYFTVRDGVLYNRDVTELVAYPSLKNQIVYTVPKTVKQIDTSNIHGDKLAVIILPDNTLNISYGGYCEYTLCRESELKNQKPCKISNVKIEKCEFGNDLLQLRWECDQKSGGTADGYAVYLYNAKLKKYGLFTTLSSNNCVPLVIGKPSVKEKYAVCAFTVQKDGSIKYGTKTTVTYDPKKKY